MPRDRAPKEDLPALNPGARMGWGVAIALFLQIFLAAALVVMLALTGASEIILPILLFFVARIIGDLARAFAGYTVGGMAVEGHSKGIAWLILIFGLGAWFHDDPDPFGSLWTVGLALGLAGASLWGHHVHAERVSTRLGKEEGTLGAVLATVGTPLAATLLPLSTPWDLVVPLVVFAFIAAVSTRALVRLLRRRHGRDHAAATGWGAWYQDHFFRLTLLLVATIAYLFVRPTLTGIIPFLFLFEYGFAVLAMGIVLWTLRNHLSTRLDEHPLTSPHRRHEQQVDRQGETAFDDMEDAFGRFLSAGDTEPLQRLSADLTAKGIRAGPALAPVTGYTREERILLVQPGWLYGARIAAVILVALAARLFVAQVDPGEPDLPSVLFLAVLAAGVYGAQWNRFGGPWWVKSAAAGAGIFLFLLLDARVRDAVPDGLGPLAALTSNPLGLLVTVLVLGLPFVHPWRAGRGKPVPRYGYAGTDPLGAIARLRQNAEAALVKRTVWALGIGVIAFFVIGELSRIAPPLAVLFPVYLISAALVVLQPLSVTAGLRLGATQVKRRHEKERATRQRLFDDALARLDQVFATPRRPRGWRDGATARSQRPAPRTTPGGTGGVGAGGVAGATGGGTHTTETR